MKRSSLVAMFVFAGMLAVVGTLTLSMSERRANAQEATTQSHPLVGTWIADTDPDDGAAAHDVFTFDSDGTYIQIDSDGAVQAGSWTATGATTATLTIVGFQAEDGEGTSVSSMKIRATIDVNDDGNSFSAQGTIEFIGSDGTSTGEAGPITATAERLAVEAPGTPVSTLEELFNSFGGEEEATPEATPAA